MARTNIAAVSITPIASNGYNLTDSADFTTLGVGADNGVTFTFATNNEVILKNPTGGAAVFTFIVAVRDAEATSVGATITDTTVTVAAGKTHILDKLSELFRDATTKLVAIDCDVAGEVLVLER